MSYRKKHKPTAKLEKVAKESLLPSEYANPGTERMIMTSKLVSGMPYQRPVEDAEVDHLIAEWDDRLLDPLIVSFRAGNFYLVDGQHRVCAVRKMNALLESGRDEEIVEIKQLLERKGFVWALNKSGSKAYEIKAARGVINAYRELGAPLFSRMLCLLDDTWHGDAASLNAAMLSGMTLFLKTYGSDIDDRAFAARLSAVDPAEILRRSKTDFSTNNRALRCARVLLKKYNSARGGKKLSYRFQG